MLLHLSDLHFGTELPERVQAVKKFCEQHQPELVIVSGDLTQRARFQQFYACRQFLESLNIPYLVVPGNHDIPLYHVWRRFFNPFGRYQLFFGATEKEIISEHFYVVGVNSIRPKYHTKGYVSTKQIAEVEAKLKNAPEHLYKLVAVHQPFYCEPFDKHVDDCPVSGEIALRHWADAGLNGLLHGHLHQSAVYHLNQFYHLDVAQSVLDIHAGTTFSNRTHHGEENGFNVITVQGEIDAYLYDESAKSFQKWKRIWPKNDMT
ncbi:metallophosphoesterase [Acinetobacter sp. A3.8]|uniref:Metallophosphoesterase n=1 Tax=Acinetobacter sedimenti TaxID=2919922 RepID=A0A9X2B7R9_9GAMM|nr:metallophosphoesterase [Acinetobacter sedimenti]MCJ8147427.1 metallophosphoesterase [Acinetobacter sedimenti]